MLLINSSLLTPQGCSSSISSSNFFYLLLLFHLNFIILSDVKLLMCAFARWSHASFFRFTALILFISFVEFMFIHCSLHSLPSLAIPITSLSLSLVFLIKLFQVGIRLLILINVSYYLQIKFLKARTYSPYLKLNQGYQNNGKMLTSTKQFAIAFRLVSLSFSFLHLLYFDLCICLLIYHWIPNFLSNLCISSNLSFSPRPLIFSNYLNYTHSLFLSVSLLMCWWRVRTCWSPRMYLLGGE